MDGYLDDTAHRNSCTIPVCISTYVNCSAAFLVGMYCLSKYSPQVLSKESKRDGEAIDAAVNMHPFIFCKIEPYLSIPWQVRLELHTKSLKR